MELALILIIFTVGCVLFVRSNYQDRRIELIEQNIDMIRNDMLMLEKSKKFVSHHLPIIQSKINALEKKK